MMSLPYGLAMTTSSVTTRRDRIDAHLASWRSTRSGRLMLLGASIALLAALYYVAAKIGLRLAYLHGSVTALWPPVGVGIAALVLYGTRLWPGIFIGDLLVGDYSSPLGTVLGQTVGNTLEVLVAAVLLRRLIGSSTGLERVGDVFALVAAAAVGTLISASFGATSLRLGDVIAAHEFEEVWRTWWLSDFSGALVVTPLILTWATRGLRGLSRWDVAEGGALLTALVLLAELPSQRDVPYVVFPVLIWAALRFGPRGAATALVVVSSLTVWNTAHNAGPFVRESITDSLLSSQLFLATAALTSLVLAAVTAERTRADEALRANEERLRSVVQSMAEGLIVRDARGRITDCNAAAEQILGLDRDRLRGRRPEDVLGAALDADDQPISSGRLLGDEALATGREEGALTARLTRADGTPAWVSISSAPVLDAGGRPEGVVSTLSDITQRRAAEQRLVASESATRALAEEQAALRRIATLVASEASPSSVFERVTEEVARLLHVPSASVLRYETDEHATVVGSWREAGLTGMPLGSSLDLEGDSVVARVYRSGRPERIDDYDNAPGPLAAHLRALGYQSSVAAPLAVGGRLWGVLVASSTTRSEGLTADAQRRLLDFADLVAQAVSNADAYDKLAGSRARIVEAGDAERRRLERNLHDGAQQRLVSLALQLRLVEARFESDPARARQDLAEAREQLNHALDELRELARGIHPAILTDGGLAPALLALANRAPLPVEIDDVPDQRLPEPIEAAAYYLIAEAITNVAKHAHASHVAVSVRRDDGRVWVRVADDGVGGADADAGSGLHGLADRVEALHGHLRVESPPGGGTRLEARIPVG
jgi:PAS domain S-box-containing protein